jgi:signal transduction histidine kinase
MPSKPMRHLLTTLFFCTIALSLSSVQASNIRDKAITVFDSADFLLDNSLSPPANDRTWQQRTLLDHWNDETRYKKGRIGWYRLNLPDQLIDQKQDLSLYLFRYNMNAAVFFNGEEIGNGGSFVEPLSRNWNHPLLIRIPETGWKARDNVLHIRLHIYPYYGFLPPLILGRYQDFIDSYDQRVFWQSTISQHFFVVTIAISFFSFWFWLRRRHEKMYFYFSLSTFFWSIFSLNLFIRDIPVSAKQWWWLVHTSIDFWMVYLILFTHRLLLIRKPVVEKLSIAFASSASIIYALTSIDTFAKVTGTLHLITLSFAIYLIAISFLQWRVKKNIEAIMLGFGVLIIFFFTVYDTILNSNIFPQILYQGFFISHLATPVLFIIISWHLSGRFMQAFNDVKDLNSNLELRVDEGKFELEKNLKKQNESELEQIATHQYEQIYTELHEDISEKIATLLHNANTSSQRDAARAVLKDLQEARSGYATKNTTLDDLLADCHNEYLQRSENSNLNLNWEALNFSKEINLPAQYAYNLSRVFRETLSNIIKHANASIVTTYIHTENDLLKILVTDNGAGIIPDQPGRGMINMKSRIAKLNGILEWSNADPVGTQISITLPLPDAT